MGRNIKWGMELKQVNFTLDADIYERFSKMAEADGLDKAKLLRSLVTDYLSGNKTVLHHKLPLHQLDYDKVMALAAKEDLLVQDAISKLINRCWLSIRGVPQKIHVIGRDVYNNVKICKLEFDVFSDKQGVVLKGDEKPMEFIYYPREV